MHDRRIDGETEVFGNAGALFMSAMTWYDHSTRSIWSQPWGRAIQGERKGVELFVLPSQVTTWAGWQAEHPDTLVMANGLERLATLRQGFDPDFVIGLLLADAAKAYRFTDVAAAGVINDEIGSTPVMVWADEANFHAYVRIAAGETLTFRLEEGNLFDRETGSRWDVVRGLAVEGPLQGEALQQVPSTSAYDWAWLDFYPESEIYAP